MSTESVPVRYTVMRIATTCGQHFWQAGLEGGVFEVRPVDAIGYRHQAHQIDDAGDAVEFLAAETELLQKKIRHDFRTVIGDFQTYGIAEMPLGQFALERGT